jgi:hypothetical protein
MNSAPLCVPSLGIEQSCTQDGGNWTAHTHACPFLFVSEQFKKLLRQITNAARVARCSGSDSAPAAPPGAVARLRTVPQALPFREVNDLTHVRLSRCETLFTTRAFA